MAAPAHLPLPKKSLIAVLLVLFCIMFLMEWANVALRGSQFDAQSVFYMSRIVGLPVMALLVWLIVREHPEILSGWFAKNGLTTRLVLTGIAVGVLARIFWWAQITARASFGLVPSSVDSPARPLSLAYKCPDWNVLLMAVIVWWILIPVTEEFIHRGVLMSSLVRHGAIVSITISTLIFTLMHPPESYVFVFMFGVVFGIFFWNVKTLWAPIITHATYDGLQVFDWICLKVTWNPDSADLPLRQTGAFGILVTVISAMAVLFLVSKRWVGSPRVTQPLVTS